MVVLGYKGSRSGSYLMDVVDFSLTIDPTREILLLQYVGAPMKVIRGECNVPRRARNVMSCRCDVMQSFREGCI